MRSRSFYPLAAVFGLYVLFLYGPVFTIFALSFQGPDGGLTFPMQGTSLHWYRELFAGLGVVDISAALKRSFGLGLVVMALTVGISLLAGLAFRKGFKGAGLLFYSSVASLIMPSIIISLGIGLQFRLFDEGIKALLTQWEWTDTLENYTTLMGLYTSGLGAHLT